MKGAAVAMTVVVAACLQTAACLQAAAMPPGGPDCSQGLGGLLEASGEFTELLSVFDAMGCDVDCLDKETCGALATFFLPADGWMGKMSAKWSYLGASTVWAMGLRANLTLYAVVPGVVYAANLTNSSNAGNQTTLTTFLGEPMSFSQAENSTGNGSSVVINGGAAEIVLPDLVGEDNATLMVQGTSALLIPPSFPNQTVQEIATGLNATNFFVALDAVDLGDTFNQSSANPVDIMAFTLFVPTNEAFAAQLAAWNATLAQFTSDYQLNALLKQVMMLHWVNAAIMTAGLALWPLIETAGGLVMNTLVLDHLVIADIAGLDGLVNSIDQVIVTAWLNASITARLAELAAPQ